MMHAALNSVSEDDEAMRRVADGDNSALAGLFDRYKSRLFAFLYHLMGDRGAAEDLVSETFLRVYLARARYRAGTAFLPWLFTIARNLALGELRHRSVVLRAQQRLAEDASMKQTEWLAEQFDLSERVREALACLPEEQRSALVLKEYHQLDYREISRILGCSEAAARARTYRARITLRELLRGWWEAQ
jgi:RNA polymerase sigma-70 factor (ECF subfamily)